MTTPSSEKVFGPVDFLRLFEKGRRKEIVILLYAALALTIWKYLPSHPLPAGTSGGSWQMTIPAYTEAIARGTELLKEEKPLPLSLFLTGEIKCFAALILMGLIPIGIVKWGFRENLSDYGLKFGNRYTIQSILIFTPVMIFLALGTAPEKYEPVYPFNPFALHVSGGLFRLHLILYAVCYYFGWEFMFRGFLLKGLAPRCGLGIAIFVQTMAATMVHYGHPLTETLGCLGGSIFWGCVALRTQSILSGWVQHATLGLTLDIMLMLRFTGMG